MTRHLTIHVRAHDARYHGDGDEMPSPFRLFQALVAGAGMSGPLDEQAKQALTWLEGLPDAPIIASPRLVRGQPVAMFMPNNDLDKFGGDVRKIAKTRGAQKVWRPRHFDASVPWIYAWPFADGETYAVAICTLSENLYQLGRGVDMAWAWGELVDGAALDARLAEYDGVVRRPSAGDDLLVACPHTGSLDSLERRYRTRRFRYDGDQRVFIQPPKPSYRHVAYESPTTRHVFELRSAADTDRRVGWPLEGASLLVVAARDAALARFGQRNADAARYLKGLRASDPKAVRAADRVRIIPLPSIGMHYADRAIRRILVEVPAACPLRAADVRWAFSGVEDLYSPETGESMGIVLAPTDDESMLRHYGSHTGARVFRSVTPVALPEGAKPRRTTPSIANNGNGERRARLATAAHAVVHAVRHANAATTVEAVRVQREPFEVAGARADGFAKGTRFAKHRLWHVEIQLGSALRGPLVLGDGRFLGLGLMAPVMDAVIGIHAFHIVDGLAASDHVRDVTHALRRAVMARVQRTLGARAELPRFFSGHERDGGPSRSAHAAHLTFAFDPGAKRLFVIAPHLIERRKPTNAELEHLRDLDTALEGFTELRAGAAGLLRLRTTRIDADTDALFGRARAWTTVTPYVVTRHPKKLSATEALATDLRIQLRRFGLPEPHVEAFDARGVAGVGLVGSARLVFDQPVAGPILVGRDRHFGGGMFRRGP